MHPNFECRGHRLRAALLACVAALSWACGGDDTQTTPHTTDTTSTADTNDTANSECPSGTLGCECDNGVCLRGQCVAGECTLCTRGEEGCLCRSDGSCQGELACRGELCVECPEGELGCACEGERCDEGGTCVDGTCAPAACAPGGDGCPCRRRSDPPCDDGLTCLGDDTCRVCSADRAGCPCNEGTDSCGAGLLCDANTCRAPRTCADLVAEGYCGANQACEQEPGLDATCVEGVCKDGFVLSQGRCVPGNPNCGSDEPGSLLNLCTSQLRTCVEAGDTAVCGPCIDDAVEQGGVCVGQLACGGGSCLNSEYCDVTGPTPTCLPLPCPPGEAKEGEGECRACNFSCGGTGLTGRVWPFRTNTSTCICETTPGYFMPPGGDTLPEVCDVDLDGWVREEVRDPALLSDAALRANARCDLVLVDTVLLRDELGIDVPVVSCLEGLLRAPEPTACTERITMPLVESLRNDTPGPLTATTTPAYGGRRLRAEEVHGLSKACVSALGDFDDNGVEDLLQVQTPQKLLSTDPRARLESFAFFIETHRAYVERAQAGRRVLVIEERFRCDDSDFPLRYDSDAALVGDDYDPADGATYWRSCTRGADPAYDPDADPPEPGFDFAQWSCENGGEGCNSIAVGPPHGSLDLRQPIAFGSTFPLDATQCELGSRFPADRQWRGLNHSSQFKCVGIGEGPGRRPLSAFDATGPLVMNLCEATACTAADPDCVESRPVVPGSASRDPSITCRAVSDVGSSDVGFAAVRYQPYGVGFGGVYEGGCISEDTEYQDTLCPPPVFTVAPSADAYGANTCKIAPCPFGKADCDGNPLNGCELDATTNQNCNGCGVACAPNRGVGDCSTGLCRVVSCQPGWEDCDRNPSNGCERNTRTLTDCGGCGVACSVDGGQASCATGVCQVANCGPNLGDCDAVEDCETPLNTNADCGGCDIPCAPANGAGNCDTGTCLVTTCAPGYDDCDNNSANGCETSLSDNSSCGECGRFCINFTASTSCIAGTCVLGQCNTGRGNCDNNQTNGCETLLNSPLNCGGCGRVCQLANANPRCTSTGTCAVDTCQSGFANCDNNAGNGCETRNAGGASCGFAIDVGEVDADTRCGVACSVTTAWQVVDSRTGTGEAWFKATLHDKIGICSADLSNRIKLSVPSGVDYDLYLWDSCGGTKLAESRKGLGVDEVITYTIDDIGLGDGSQVYWIEVRFNAGGSCNEWSLTIEGRNNGC